MLMLINDNIIGMIWDIKDIIKEENKDNYQMLLAYCKLWVTNVLPVLPTFYVVNLGIVTL